MKISFLILNLGVFGSVREVVMLSNLLIKRGYEVTIYTGDGIICNWLKCHAKLAPVVRFLSDKHDVVIFINTQYYQIVKQVEARLKICDVMGLGECGQTLKNILTSDVETDKNTSDLRSALHDPTIQFVSDWTAGNNWIKQEIGRYCLPVLSGLDFSLFYPHHVKRERGMILATGRPRTIEGTTEVLQVVKEVQKTHPKVKLEMYAKRDYPQEYLATLYSSCSIFLSARHRGGWDNPVGEAFACGAPVVCTDLTGNGDFAVNGKNCIKVQVGDVKAMVEAVNLFLGNPIYAASLGASAVEAVKPFSWEHSCDQLISAIEYYGNDYAD
jgi:hypothetical protein